MGALGKIAGPLKEHSGMVGLPQTDKNDCSASDYDMVVWAQARRAAYAARVAPPARRGNAGVFGPKSARFPGNG